MRARRAGNPPRVANTSQLGGGVARRGPGAVGQRSLLPYGARSPFGRLSAQHAQTPQFNLLPSVGSEDQRTTMRVLVVDDEPAARRRLALMLEELDEEVIGQAANGVEALEMARERRPELLLL